MHADLVVCVPGGSATLTDDSAPAFVDRVATRVRPSGALATVEDRRTIVLLMTVTSWSGVVLAALGAVSFWRYGETEAGWGLIFLSTAYIVGWVVFVATGSVLSTAVIAVASSAIVNGYMHVELGGFAYSGGLIMWAITLTLVAAVFISTRTAAILTAIFAIAAIVFALLEDRLAAGRVAPDAGLSSQMFAFALIGNLLILTPLFVYLLNRLGFERGRAENLLLNVLPREVAAELKESGKVEPRRFASISVLFADIAGFTPMASDMDPVDLVAHLNAVFSAFDAITERYGCEKIRTIGDAYMVAAGVPTPQRDHAHSAARIALAMVDYASTSPFEFRIGINSGPVVAGVIGTTKFQYDVWGDTVNVASRMESHGEVGRIQISRSTYDLIHDDFSCVRRGTIDVKGRGTIETWYLGAPNGDA